MTTGRRPAVGSFISAEWRMLGVVPISAVVVVICFVILSIFARCIAIAVAGPMCVGAGIGAAGDSCRNAQLTRNDETSHASAGCQTVGDWLPDATDAL